MLITNIYTTLLTALCSLHILNGSVKTTHIFFRAFLQFHCFFPNCILKPIIHPKLTVQNLIFRSGKLCFWHIQYNQEQFLLNFLLQWSSKAQLSICNLVISQVALSYVPRVPFCSRVWFHPINTTISLPLSNCQKGKHFLEVCGLPVQQHIHCICTSHVCDCQHCQLCNVHSRWRWRKK